MSFLTGFINGLKKSFNGKTYTRDLEMCNVCSKPAYFMDRCLYCSTAEVYKK